MVAVFCVISKYHNCSLTSINRFFLQWGRYFMGFITRLLVQNYSLWSMLLLVLYLRERLTKTSMTSSFMWRKLRIWWRTSGNPYLIHFLFKKNVFQRIIWLQSFSGDEKFFWLNCIANVQLASSIELYCKHLPL